MYKCEETAAEPLLPTKTAISRQIYLISFFAEVDISSVVKCYSKVNALKIGGYQRFIGAM